MKNELYKKVDQVPEGVLRHFAIVLDKIVACYTNESSRALIMTSEGEGDSPQLGMIGVNLNDTQTEMMMDTLCAFRTNERQATQGALN